MFSREGVADVLRETFWRTVTDCRVKVVVLSYQDSPSGAEPMMMALREGFRELEYEEEKVYPDISALNMSNPPSIVKGASGRSTST